VAVTAVVKRVAQRKALGRRAVAKMIATQ